MARLKIDGRWPVPSTRGRQRGKKLGHFQVYPSNYNETNESNEGTC